MKHTKSTQNQKNTTPEAIAKMADQGKNIVRFYKGKGQMVQPIQLVHVDLIEAIKTVKTHERGN